MKVTEAFRRPFQDLKTLIIGIVIMIIPIVNFTVGLGYFLKCAETTLKKKNNLPKWENWGGLFMKGLLAFIINLIYAIPVFIVLGLTVGTAILSGGVSSMFTGGTLTAVNSLATLGLGLIVTLIVAFFISLLSSAAMIRFAEKGTFGAAFELRAVMKKAFTGTYFGAWLMVMILSVIIVILLAMIPIIGGAIGAFIAGVAVYTFLAEAYKKA